MDTAAIVLEGRDVPITYTKKLKEMSWGDYEGALISAYQEEIDKRRFGNRDWSDVGGENPAMMKKRITDVFSWIFDQSADVYVEGHLQIRSGQGLCEDEKGGKKHASGETRLCGGLSHAGRDFRAFRFKKY